jgi:hypothetical protein
MELSHICGCGHGSRFVIARLMLNDQQPTVCSIAASPTSSPLLAFDER